MSLNTFPNHQYDTALKNIKHYFENNKQYLASKNYYIDTQKLGFKVLYNSDKSKYLLILDESNKWESKEDLKGLINFLISGPGTINFINCTFNGIFIKRMIVVGKDLFETFLTQTKEFMDSFIYFAEYPHKYDDNLELKLKIFEELVSNNEKELTIDKFIENNPFILEMGLQVEKLNHQVVLKDYEDEFGQDLKPDVIAFKPLENKWYIIDYKRSKSNILKNSNKVRTSFRSEVNDLQGQLRDYLDYFYNNKNNRENFEKKYNFRIEYPNSIGIIGQLDKSKQREFDKIMNDLSRKYQFVPYNYLIDECKRQIDLRKENH